MTVAYLVIALIIILLGSRLNYFKSSRNAVFKGSILAYRVKRTLQNHHSTTKVINTQGQPCELVKEWLPFPTKIVSGLAYTVTVLVSDKYNTS